MSSRLTRQEFLDKTARATATFGLLGATPLLKTPVLKYLRNQPTSVVRRDIGGLAAADPVLNAYRAAITAMKALPASDPRSWTYQAAIHGTLVSPAMTAWNTCEHGSYWFWSWHRMYLYYFERIIRKMSGDSSFALPYWNYTSASERQLPAPFRDSSSSLYVSQRAAGFNSGASSLSAADTSYSGPFLNTDFATASAQLEGTPHGVVHVRVGGPSGLMGSVPTAALDPIFYLHHCNIDRLWNLWLAQGGGRTDPLSDSTWKSMKFTFFDENKKQVQLTSCDVLRCASQLGHTYEGEPAEVNLFCNRFVICCKYFYKLLLRWPIDRFVVAQRPFAVKVDITKVRSQLQRAVEDKLQQVCLWLEDVDAARQPGVVWQVFLGGPDTKLDPEGPAFVGNMALFGMGLRNEKQTKFMPAKFSFTVDGAVDAALKSQAGTLELTLVPTGPLVRGKVSPPKLASKVRVGRVSLVIQTQQKQ